MVSKAESEAQIGYISRVNCMKEASVPKKTCSIRSVVAIQYRLVTNRRTDRQAQTQGHD